MELRIVCIAALTIFWACGNDQQASSEAVSTGDEIVDSLTLELQKDSLNPDFYLARGDRYFEKEVYSESIRDYKKALQLDSSRASIYHKLSDSYLNYNMSYEALQVMKDARGAFPDSASTQLKLAELHFILKQYLEAMQIVDNLISKQPGNADAHFLKGLIYRDMDTPLKAVESFQRAVELDAELTDAHLLMGDMMKTEDEEMALQFYENAVVAAPESTEALRALALHLHQMGRLEEAEKTYEKLHVMDPQASAPFYNAALLQIEIDSLEKAKKFLDIAIGNQPDFAKAYFYRAEVLNSLGEQKQALEDLRKLQKLRPDQEGITERIAKLEQDLDSANLQ